MNDRHVVDELSAYLDGKARDPERIARHLDHCPQCTQRYIALTRLSQQLRALPAPEVHPAFTMRVMARVAETAPAPRRSWRVTAVAAAAVVAVIGLSVALLGRDGAAPSVAKHPAALPVVFEEEWVVSALASRMDAGEPPAVWWSDEPVLVAGEQDAVPEEDWLTALATAPWFEPLADSMDAQTDLDTLVASLDEAETAAFRLLLQDYAAQDAS